MYDLSPLPLGDSSSPLQLLLPYTFEVTSRPLRFLRHLSPSPGEGILLSISMRSVEGHGVGGAEVWSVGKGLESSNILLSFPNRLARVPRGR